MSILKGILVYGGLGTILYDSVQTFILGFNFIPQILNVTTLPYIASGVVVVGAYYVE